MFYQNRRRALPAFIAIFLLLAAVSLPAQISNSMASTEIKELSLKKNIRSNKNSKLRTIYGQRIEKLKRELLASPDDAALYNNLGASYAALRNFKEAVAPLEKAIALNPDFYNAYYNLGIVYDHLERYPEALEAIQKAVALNGTYINAREEMCQLYLVMEKFSEGAACYETLFKMKPPDVRTRTNYAHAFLQLEQYDKASVVLKENVALFPNEAMAHNALGMLFFTKKKYRQARECFSRAVELDALYEPARYNLALTQLATNDRAAALQQYALLKTSNPEYAAALYKFIFRDKVIYANKK